MGKITLRGFILVPQHERAMIERALPTHIRLTEEEVGCLAFSVTSDVHNPLRFNVHEVFIDQAAFEVHQARVRTSFWGRVTRNVERHYHIESSE